MSGRTYYIDIDAKDDSNSFLKNYTDYQSKINGYVSDSWHDKILSLQKINQYNVVRDLTKNKKK